MLCKFQGLLALLRGSAELGVGKIALIAVRLRI